MWLWLFVVNAVLGIGLFEYAWAQTKRHRTVDEERDSHFPAWRRYDAPHWSKLMMYPVAATLLIPRFGSFLVIFLMSSVLNKILLFGTDVNKDIPDSKRFWSRMIFKYCGWAIALAIGIFIKVKRVNVDYSKWLGPDYKKKKLAGRAPTYVSNHMGFTDGCVTLWALDGDISYLAADMTKDIPMVGYNIRASQGIFCPRGGTPEERQRNVQEIADRQAAVEEGRTKKSPLMIFAEGSTSNNTHITPFKRGAFESLKSCVPMSIQYGCP